MSQYTVYAFDPSAIGDGYSEQEIARLNELLAEEVDKRGLNAKILCTEDAGRYTFLTNSDSEEAEAQNAAIERFYAEFQ